MKDTSRFKTQKTLTKATIEQAERMCEYGRIEVSIFGEIESWEYQHHVRSL